MTRKKSKTRMTIANLFALHKKNLALDIKKVDIKHWSLESHLGLLE